MEHHDTKDQCARCGRFVKKGYLPTHMSTLLCVRGGAVHPAVLKARYHSSPKGRAVLAKAKAKHKAKKTNKPSVFINTDECTLSFD